MRGELFCSVQPPLGPPHVTTCSSSRLKSTSTRTLKSKNTGVPTSSHRKQPLQNLRRTSFRSKTSDQSGSFGPDLRLINPSVTSPRPDLTLSTPTAVVLYRGSPTHMMYCFHWVAAHQKCSVEVQWSSALELNEAHLIALVRLFVFTSRSSQLKDCWTIIQHLHSMFVGGGRTHGKTGICGQSAFLLSLRTDSCCFR